MNVSTASTAAAASASGVNSTQSSTRTNSIEKTSEKSFDEEMKTASETDETKETAQEDAKVSDEKKTSEEESSSKDKEKLSNEQNVQDDIVTDEMLNGSVNFTDYKYHNEGQSILSQNIQNLLNVINMSDSDANFFADLVQNTDMSMKSIASQIDSAMSSNTQNIQQNVKVSSVLMEKLSESMRTNQPFRIDFDKDVSVIIKVNKDGSLAANFIPGDKAVEQYLRNNISSLRQRFDEQNLPYSDLSYSNSRRQQQERRKNKQGEES